MSSMDMIIKRRINEITPDESVDGKTFEELVKDCHIAFEIIGYKSINLEKTVHKVSKSFEDKSWDHNLATFIFNVWRADS